MDHERSSIDPNVMVGKPYIRGTRIRAEYVLRLLAGGMLAAESLRGIFGGGGGGLFGGHAHADDGALQRSEDRAQDAEQDLSDAQSDLAADDAALDEQQDNSDDQGGGDDGGGIDV